MAEQTYSRISDVPDNLRSVSPVTNGQAVALSLAQINVLAMLYDKYRNDDGNVVEKAKSDFRKLYIVKNGKWVKDTMAIGEENSEMTSTSDFNEVWYDMPGSYEDIMAKINVAAKKDYTKFKAEDRYRIGIKATFRSKVIVEVWTYDDVNGRSSKYYQANWSENEDDDIEFDDIEEIEFDVAIKKVNECQELVEVMRDATNTRELNETIVTEVLLEEVEVDGSTILRGKVPVAQRADIRNGNRRVYTVQALENGVVEAQKTIAKYGGLRMEDGHHFDEKGKNKSSLARTAGIIKQLSWHPDSKTVSLDEIELLLETEAGRSIRALLEKEYKPQVSQRAIGSAEVVKEDDGQIVEKVNYVKFQGWDFLPGGEASVSDATFEVITEGLDMPDKVLGEKEVTELIQNSIVEVKDETSQLITEQTQSVIESITTTLKEAGILIEQTDKSTENEDEPASTDKDTNEKDERIESLLQEIKSLNERVDNGEKETAELKKEKEISYLNEVGRQYLQQAVQAEKYDSFNSEQKSRLIESIRPSSLYGKVDIQDKKQIGELLEELLSAEASKVNGFIADMKLKELGVMDEEGQIKKMSEHGIARIEVNEQTPGMEYMSKLESAVQSRLKLTDTWVMPKGHSSEFALDSILKEFDEQHWQQLQAEAKTLTEANEVIQTSIGPRVAMISRTIIPIAWRRLSALQVMDVGPTMGSRIVDIPVAAWGPSETSDLADDIGAIMVADDGDIPVGGISYTNYPLYATRLALSAEIRSEAIATAKGTSMDPVADALAGLTRDIATRLDRLFWQVQITKAQMFTSSYTEETTFQDMVDLGNNVWAFSGDDGSTAIDGGVLRYEWVKSIDANGNPTGTDIIKLYGTVETANTLQEIVVQDDDDTALIYDTDYSVNWLDGTITLTLTGIAKVNEGLEAKLTFANASGTHNTKFWSVTPPTGVTLYDHLINLRQQVGGAKVLVGNRHYQPNYIGFSLEMEDLIASGPQFTEMGRFPGEIMDRLATVMNYGGLEPVRSSAIPNGYIIIGVKGATSYRVHTPLQLVGPYKIDIKGHDYYHVEEYSGFDVPVMDKLSTVLVTDL
jgi:hypothetical protein